MENLKNISSYDLMAELINRAMTRDELDDKINNVETVENAVTLDEYFTNAYTVTLWFPKK